MIYNNPNLRISMQIPDTPVGQVVTQFMHPRTYIPQRLLRTLNMDTPYAQISYIFLIASYPSS